MNPHEKDPAETQPAPFNALPTDNMSDPAIADYLSETRQEFGKYLRSLEDTRRVVDEAMGDATFSEILGEMKQSKPW